MCVYSVQIKSIHDLNQFLENKRRMNNRRLFLISFVKIKSFSLLIVLIMNFFLDLINTFLWCISNKQANEMLKLSFSMLNMLVDVPVMLKDTLKS